MTTFTPDFLPLFEDTPWGVADQRRGENHHGLALAFIAAFPLGTELTVDKFDQWVQQRGLLNTPFGAPTDSDAWKAHIYRRNDLRKKMNKAGAHPRMHASGAVPFTIEFVADGRYAVQSPQVTITTTRVPRKVRSFCATQLRAIDYLMQAPDWTQIPPLDRAVVELIYSRIDNFEKRVMFDLQCLTTDLRQIEKRLGLTLGPSAGTAHTGEQLPLLPDAKD